jgi:hypothetical protein
MPGVLKRASSGHRQRPDEKTTLPFWMTSTTRSLALKITGDARDAW